MAQTIIITNDNDLFSQNLNIHLKNTTTYYFYYYYPTNND